MCVCACVCRGEKVLYYCTCFGEFALYSSAVEIEYKCGKLIFTPF